MSYRFEKATAEDVAALRQDCLRQLTAPLDGMWESFVSMADDYVICRKGKIIGHCSVDAAQKILQFHTPEVPDPHASFHQALTTLDITGAVAATCDPHFLSLCLDHQQSVSVNALMYHLTETTVIEPVTFPPNMDFRAVGFSELETALAFGTETLRADRNWLTSYFTERIEGGELFGLWQNKQLIATGECRPSKTQKAYTDLGMMVAENQRGKGLATRILRRLLHLSRKRGLIPICSTESGNIAAQKAIIRSGFTSYHRILDITF